MVVHNFYFKGVCIGPPEGDSPLIVDANAVLPLAITRKSLETITGNGSKIRQGSGRMNMACTLSATTV